MIFSVISAAPSVAAITNSPSHPSIFVTTVKTLTHRSHLIPTVLLLYSQVMILTFTAPSHKQVLYKENHTSQNLRVISMVVPSHFLAIHLFSKCLLMSLYASTSTLLTHIYIDSLSLSLSHTHTHTHTHRVTHTHIHTHTHTHTHIHTHACTHTNAHTHTHTHTYTHTHIHTHKHTHTHTHTHMHTCTHTHMHTHTHTHTHAHTHTHTHAHTHTHTHTKYT